MVTPQPTTSASFEKFLTEVAVKSVAKLFFCYSLISIWALVRGFRSGFGESGVVIVLCGAVFCFVTCMTHAHYVTFFQERRKDGVTKMAVLGQLLTVTFIFNMYLVFYRGLWSMVAQFGSFSMSALFVSFVFVIAGGIATIAVGDLMKIERYASRGSDLNDKAQAAEPGATDNPDDAQ